MRVTRTYKSYEMAERVDRKLRGIRGADYNSSLEGVWCGRDGHPTVLTNALTNEIELAERLASAETRILDMRQVMARMRDLTEEIGESGIRG